MIYFLIEIFTQIYTCVFNLHLSHKNWYISNIEIDNKIEPIISVIQWTPEIIRPTTKNNIKVMDRTDNIPFAFLFFM